MATQIDPLRRLSARSNVPGGPLPSPSIRAAVQSPTDGFESVPKNIASGALAVNAAPQGAKGVHAAFNLGNFGGAPDAAPAGSVDLSDLASVDPSTFQGGQTYRQTFDSNTRQYTYTAVAPTDVPRGALVYVNGYNSSGGAAANYAQQISQQQQNRNVYVVYNDTPWYDINDLSAANSDPGGDHFAPIDTVRQILEHNGGVQTLMGHSMGSEIIADAAYQYHQEGGQLKQTYLYGWGGTANANNVDQISQWGANYQNFVHEEIDQVDANGNQNVVQTGDAWAGSNSSSIGGNNWATKTEDSNGTVTQYQTNDVHTIGIDYSGGANPGTSSGHDYTGQVGNTLGGFVTPEG